jgi:hypothetical protein
MEPEWPLPWATLVQAIPPHPVSLRTNLISSSHLGMDLPSDLFLSGLYNEVELSK